MKVRRTSIKFPLLLTFAGVLLAMFAFTVMNPPMCPDNFTQAQIDASNCVIGANIGLGLIVLFVLMPFAVVLAVVWALYLLGLTSARKGTNKK